MAILNPDYTNFVSREMCWLLAGFAAAYVTYQVLYPDADSSATVD